MKNKTAPTLDIVIVALIRSVPRAMRRVWPEFQQFSYQLLAVLLVGTTLFTTVPLSAADLAPVSSTGQASYSSLGLHGSRQLSGLTSEANARITPLQSTASPVVHAIAPKRIVLDKALSIRPTTQHQPQGPQAEPAQFASLNPSLDHIALGTFLLGDVQAALTQISSPQGISVSVGFADSTSASANFPTPWQGSTNGVFLGDGGPYKAGTIRLDNPTGSSIAVDSVSVDVGRPGPVFNNLWGSFIIPANGSVILTQTAAGNFNTSASPITTCGGTLQPNETRIPKITVTIAGVPASYLDSSHVLDTGGFDLSCRGNESLAWRSIGTTGIEAPSAGITLSPASSITAVGVADSLEAQVTDANGQPLANASANFKVLSGSNVGSSAQVNTDTQGNGVANYTSAVQGADIWQAALANITTGAVSSNQVTANWVSSAACPLPASAPGSTQLLYLGQTTGNYNEPFHLAAMLSDANGNPLSSRTVVFAYNGQNTSVTTDANGLAQATVAAGAPGTSTVAVSFAGDANNQSAQTSASATITAEATVLHYTGSTLIGTSAPQTVTALLIDGDQDPIAHETITFQAAGISAQAVTNAQGMATATLTLPSTAGGTNQMQVSFAGDNNYLAAATTVPIDIYLSSSFVVWGGNSGGLHLGQDVNFWGAQWASQVTGGDYTANPSFKGYATPVGAISLCEALAGTGQQSLNDSCWQSKPGNSGPPSTLPAYIEVIVSNAITKQGSEIYGNIASLAVCKVDATPAYGSDPGQPGYCHITTIVADGAGIFPPPAVIKVTQSQSSTVLPAQNYSVVAKVSNNGGTEADSVALSESFDGVTPAVGSNSWSSIGASASQTATFQETVPAITSRQSSESSTQYEQRLGSLDGRLYTSSATVTFTDPAGQPYLPVYATSFSKLTLPRLSLAISGPACISPGAKIPYQVTVTNLGSATAQSGSLAVTLPDGSTSNVTVPNLAAGTSFVTTVNWTVPVIAPKASGETTAQYLARLSSFDGQQFTVLAQVNWQDANGNSYGTVAQQFISTVERVPVVTVTAQVPISVVPAQTTTFNFTVQNTGGGNAIQTDLRVTNPDATSATPSPFSLAAGASTQLSTKWAAPVIAPKGAPETDTAYFARLGAVDNSLQTVSYSLDWTDAAGAKFGPTIDSSKMVEQLPILTVALAGPTAANAGDTISYTVTFQNIGHAAASLLSLSVKMPDGSVQSPALSGGLAPGATAQVSLSFTVPKTQAPGTVSTTAILGWTDALLNSYGTISSVASTQIKQPNQPPVVNAGPNQTITLPTNTVTLNGTATDDGLPNGTLIINWTELSGGAPVTFSNPSNAVTQASFTQPGTYVLQLSANDTQYTSTSIMTVQVLPSGPNKPPVVSAGPDLTVTLPSSANLQGSATDDGLPSGTLSIQWSKLSGPGPVTFANAASPVTTASFTRSGSYILLLSANDSQYISSATTTVTVISNNQPPVVSAGTNQTIVWPTNTVTLSGSVTDDGLPVGGTLTSLWSKVIGPGVVTFANPGSPVTTARFSKPGTYVLQLSANDGQLTSTASVLIYVGHLSCARSNASTDYWITFPGACSGNNCGAAFPNPILYMTGTANTTGSISIAELGYSTSFTVTANQVTEVNLPQAADLGSSSDLVEQKAIHITAQEPISVYPVNQVPFATDGYMALPTSMLGTDYVAIGYKNEAGPPGFSSAMGTEFAIVAAADNTTVTITPTVSTSGREGHVPYSVTLNQGSTYQLKNTELFANGVSEPDLSGSIITSDKPIAVFGAHDCTFVPDGYVFCDHLVEQMPPTSEWGTNFVTVPFSARKNGDVFRFTASQDGTHVFVNGVPATTLNRGAFYEEILATPSQISADKPILVVQYGTSIGYGGSADSSGVDGDPFMVTVQPYDQFGGSVTLATPMNGFPDNFINVVAPSSAKGNITLDGSAIPAAAFTDIGNSGFSGAQLQIAIGTHSLQSSVPFGSNIYGYGIDNGYGYNGSACLATSSDNSSLTLTPQSLSTPVGAQACVQATVLDVSGAPIGGAAIDYKTGGVNAITGTVQTDATGTANICYLSKVNGSDLLTATSGDLTQTASINWTSNGPNQPPVVNAGANQSITLPLNTITLNGSVFDDGLPTGSTLTIQWSEISGPVSVVFSNPSQAVTQASFSATGSYVLQLSANDTQYTTTSKVTVTVFAQNQPPVVNAGANFTVNVGTLYQLQGSASDDGLPVGSTLTTQWSLLSGTSLPQFVTSQSSPTASVLFSQPGTDVMALSASDGQYTTVAYVTATVIPNITAPAVFAGFGQSAVQSLPVQLNGALEFGTQPVSFAWSALAGPGTVSFTTPNALSTMATFSAAGSYTLQLTGTNSAGTGSSTTQVTVNAPAGPPPTVTITSPADTSDVTKPSPIVGSVNGSTTTTYQLQFSPVAADGSTAQWTQFASGSAPVTNGTLGTFDPTLLMNGLYAIQLTATDSQGQSASTSVMVEVRGNMKLGFFHLSFNDLTVPLPGLSIQVVRTYDTRQTATQGDFGFGWTLSVNSATVRKNGQLGKSWFESVDVVNGFTRYCLQPVQNHVVSIAFPDGRVYKFQLGPQCQSLAPIDVPQFNFQQMPTGSVTAGAQLQVVGATDAVVDGSVPGPADLVGFNSDIFDAGTYQLTTADGIVYVIDQVNGIQTITDRNGNQLTFTPDGITHSSGKSVVFQRDTQGRIISITDPNGAEVGYEYSDSGDLVQSVDRSKNVSSFQYSRQAGQAHFMSGYSLPVTTTPNPTVQTSYDSTGRMTSLSGAAGPSLGYGYDITNQTETVSGQMPANIKYTYDDDGNILETDYISGGVTISSNSATYDSNDNKLSETNALGKTSFYTYDALGNRNSEKDPLGNLTQYQYNNHKQVLQVTDARNNVTVNQYDPNGNLTLTTDAANNQTLYTYTGNGLPLTVTDAAQNLTQFQYAANGNLAQQTDALSHVSSYTYDGNGNKLTQTVTRTVNVAPQQLTTQYGYDGSGRLVKTTNPDGSFTQSQYDANGRLAVSIDALGHQTRYKYDDAGRRTETDYADGSSDTAQYDSFGNRSQSKDRDGLFTTYRYDAQNRLSSTNYPDGTRSSTIYDAAGQVTSTTSRAGVVATFGYDDAGRRSSVTDALNHSTQFGYDAAGNQSSITDANQHLTQYVYDALNRRTGTIYPDASTDSTTYDALGRVSQKTDQGGKVTAYGYDSLGRLTSVTQDAVAGGLNLLTQYGYDELGNRRSQTDANNHTTSYKYDQLGRRIGRTLPLGQSESYSYDAAGNLQSKNDFNGRTTAYSYDANNRLSAKTADPFFSTGSCAPAAGNPLPCGATQVSFTYTAAGRRKSMTDASGATQYSYSGGNLSQVTTPEGALGYQYTLGQVTTVNNSEFNGVFLNYSYDADGRLSQVLDVRNPAQPTNYTYDPAGNLATVKYGNAVTTSYTYDALNRLTQMGAVNVSAAPLSSYTYTLGAAGNRTGVTELSARKVDYGYDNLYRLTSETISGASSQNGTISYQYDSVGNRLNMTSTVPAIPPGLFNYDANDRLTTDNYDSAGNTTSSGGITDVYDFENHLVQHGAVSIVYDGDGNRVSEAVGGVTTTYLVDSNNQTGYAQVVEEYQSGSESRQYTYGLGLISERRLGNGGGFSFYGYDGHGSVRQLFSTSGAITDTYDYDAFGNLIASTGTTLNNYLFAGEQYDAALGLYYNRARYLNTNTGRFWGMDLDEGDDQAPLSLHKYLYAAANSVNSVDPSGFDETDDTIFGRRVHQLIGNDFVEATGGIGYSNRTINTILGQYVPIFGLLRPDLANPLTAEAYEIKPVTDLIGGIAQLTAYLAVLRTFDNQKRNWRYGWSYTPSKNPLSLGTGVFALIFPPVNGVIPYKIINFPELVVVAIGGVAVATAELIQDVGVADLEEAY